MTHTGLKIYVASSWRNMQQPRVVEVLRGLGFDVYDFKNPEPGDDGFSWREIDPNWRDWTTEQYREALEHPIAQHGFGLDMRALKSADLCVLVLPSGRSASFEFGLHRGRTGRNGVVYIPDGIACEPELMYSGALIAANEGELVEFVARQAAEVTAPLSDD